MLFSIVCRRMFPTVRVSFSGPLRYNQPSDRYAVLLDVIPMDNRRYRYAYHRSQWLVAGKSDPPPPARCKLSTLEKRIYYAMIPVH